MLELVPVEDFITKIQKIDDLEQLHLAFAQEIETLGFDKYTCLSFVDMNDPPADAIQVFRFPEKWVERYKQKEYYKDDIVIQCLLNQSGPYGWKNLDTSGKRNPQIFSEAREFGILAGMTVPITLPGHYPCSINIAGDQVHTDPNSFHILHLIAEYYYFRIVDLSKQDKKSYVLPSLTPREHECLIWMAKGKSDYEIGYILSISSRTVNGYIENIRKKFDANTRTRAVALAVFAGIITP